MAPYSYTGEGLKPGGISGDYLTARACGSRRNYQIMCSSRPPCLVNVSEQPRMSFCNAQVVILNLDGGQDGFSKLRSATPVFPIGQFHSNQKFGCCDCGNSYIIVVRDDLVQLWAATLC